MYIFIFSKMSDIFKWYHAFLYDSKESSFYLEHVYVSNFRSSISQLDFHFEPNH